jgi:DNA-binding transcriptional MerR regulator
MAAVELQSTEGSGLRQRTEVFTSGDVAAIVGTTLGEVDYWVRRKLLAPSLRQATGSGSRRLFSRDDLRRAVLVHQLRKAEWQPKLIARALVSIDGALKDPDTLQTPLLIHEGRSLLILCRERNKEPVLLDAACPGQHVMVIALEALDEKTWLATARSK